MFRTLSAILCRECLPYRDSAIMARLIGRYTCNRCGKRSGTPNSAQRGCAR